MLAERIADKTSVKQPSRPSEIQLVAQSPSSASLKVTLHELTDIKQCDEHQPPIAHQSGTALSKEDLDDMAPYSYKEGVVHASASIKEDIGTTGMIIPCNRKRNPVWLMLAILFGLISLSMTLGIIFGTLNSLSSIKTEFISRVLIGATILLLLAACFWVITSLFARKYLGKVKSGKQGSTVNNINDANKNRQAAPQGNQAPLQQLAPITQSRKMTSSNNLKLIHYMTSELAFRFIESKNEEYHVEFVRRLNHVGLLHDLIEKTWKMETELITKNLERWFRRIKTNERNEINKLGLCSYWWWRNEYEKMVILMAYKSGEEGLKQYTGLLSISEVIAITDEAAFLVAYEHENEEIKDEFFNLLYNIGKKQLFTQDIFDRLTQLGWSNEQIRLFGEDEIKISHKFKFHYEMEYAPFGVNV